MGQPRGHLRLAEPASVTFQCFLPEPVGFLWGPGGAGFCQVGGKERGAGAGDWGSAGKRAVSHGL